MSTGKVSKAAWPASPRECPSTAPDLSYRAAAELRGSRLPSGWTPLQLLRHLTFVERRWLVWGFEGESGDRWDGAPPATLERVLLHLVQEYARHVGPLDVVRELVDGHAGE